VTEEILAEITRRIVEAVHPQKIVLFGSFAGGTPDADSDVDLLIVVESDLRPAERAIAVERLLWPRPFPIDVLVRTPAEIEAALRAGDHFLSSVLRHGWTLYARSE
jgi:predicted nucleotidyltransferase